MASGYFFTGPDIRSIIAQWSNTLAQEIEQLEPDYLLNSSETDLVAWLADKYRINVPFIKDDEMYVADHGEGRVDISQDPLRHIVNQSRPFYVPGTRVTLAVPFDGDAKFFQVKPNTYTTTLPSAGEIVGNEIHFTYTVETSNDQAGKMLQAQCGRTLGEINQYLGWTKQSTDQFNARLEPSIRERIANRKKRILDGMGMVASLGLPIKRREGVPITYAVPVERRKTRIERPKPSTAHFQPEPALVLQEYENILSILRNMVLVMERSPTAFVKMREEDLRTHFLVQLNGQYEGQATGETFNYQGKTDIFVQEKGRNVFVAECKIWRGEKSLVKTLDQILSYLSWRDTKAAILIFNRKISLSAVLEKIAPTVKSHPCFKREQRVSDETVFRYVFHQPGDLNREVWLTVMVFNIPSG